MKKTLIAIIALIFLAGCADKFLAAKIAIQTGRLATNVAQMGFDEAYKQQKTICLKKDPSQSQAYQECMKKILKAQGIFGKSKATALAAFAAAEAAVIAAELKQQGKSVEVLPLVQAGFCVIAESLEYVPEKYKAKIQLYLNLMKAWGCQK